jgi:glycerophosphoryl diester phosphodiesterase
VTLTAVRRICRHTSNPAFRTRVSTLTSLAWTGRRTNERNGCFGLQAHRGGRGEWTEESLAAFANSLKLGVSTLQLHSHPTGAHGPWHDV